MLDNEVAKCYLAIMTRADLKKKRERLGLTQVELARRLGVERITVIRWEGGKTEIPRTVELALREIERQEGR